jgi:hypothetical protein
MRRWVVLLPLVFWACGHCSDDMPLNRPEGLLPGYSDLRCLLWDYDSTVLSFSYRLPDGIQPESALSRLEAQVNRSRWLEGVSPPITCFRTLARRADYLLVSCENPGGMGTTAAWEFVVEGSRVRVTTGPAHDVLKYFVQK